MASYSVITFHEVLESRERNPGVRQRVYVQADFGGVEIQKRELDAACSVVARSADP